MTNSPKHLVGQNLAALPLVIQLNNGEKLQSAQCSAHGHWLLKKGVIEKARLLGLTFVALIGISFCGLYCTLGPHILF